MASWEEVVTTAKGFAVSAGRKVTNMADVVNLKLELTENERAIRDVMEALGHLLYDSHHDEIALNEELVSELIQQADTYYAENRRLQAAIDSRCDRKTCSCGAVNPENASFCNACGEKL